MIGIALAFTLAISGRAQVPIGAVDVPLSVLRAPVVLIVTDADAPSPLTDALKANGVASLLSTTRDRGTSPADLERRVRDVVDRLTALRNDARFPTFSVIGLGAAAPVAAMAARLGRADGFVSIASIGAAADVARLIVPVLDAPDGERGAKAIADFVRGVSPLGRNGTREQRPVAPRLSPRHVAIATLGGTLVGIEHGSPQTRGRAIWGALVPWDRVWMPGADEATTLSTSVPVSIGDLSVPAGDHTFYLWPQVDRVQLIVSRDVGQFHTVYNPQQELGRVGLTLTRRTDRAEGMMFRLDPAEAGGLMLKLVWDDREYGVRVTLAGTALAPVMARGRDVARRGRPAPAWADSRQESGLNSQTALARSLK